ncbi:MAG: type II toxin-antitoxin system VapB family antitoxin [Rickettsiales bacterium]
MEDSKDIITAKLFKNGNSQAVRLPKQFRFEGSEVFIYRDGKKVIIEQKDSSAPSVRKKIWEDFFYNTPLVDADFLSERGDEPPQKRKLF